MPPLVALYWVIKIASTTLGETGADMASMTFGLGYGATIVLFLVLFAALLLGKLIAGACHPILYCAVFTASAVAGTAVSDFHRPLGLGYAGGALLLAAALCAVLALWFRVERSIAVERIASARSGVFYWTAFLVANTLGTAAGDLLADDLGSGIAWSAGLISAVLLGLALLQRFTDTPRMLLFWLAFVLTRPFGATFGDLLTKPREQGGLDLGTVGASAFFAVILIVAIAREMQLSGRRRQV